MSSLTTLFRSCPEARLPATISAHVGLPTLEYKLATGDVYLPRYPDTAVTNECLAGGRAGGGWGALCHRWCQFFVSLKGVSRWCQSVVSVDVVSRWDQELVSVGGVTRCDVSQWSLSILLVGSFSSRCRSIV